MKNTDKKSALVPAALRKDFDDEAFFTMLAHELRSPLSALSSGIRLLSMGPDQEERDWTVKMLGNQVKQMTALVDCVLEFVRVSNGSAILEPAAIDLHALAGKTVHTLDEALQQRRQKVVVHGALAKPLRVDTFRFGQALEALFRDVLRSLADGDVLTVGFVDEADTAVICIEPSDVPFLAEPEQDMCSEPVDLRLAANSYHIGVLLADAVIQRHGGTLEGTRLATGRGTRYIVRIPH